MGIIRNRQKLISLIKSLFFLLGLPWTSCRAADRVHIRYSHNFQVSYRDGVTLITVSNPWRDAGVGFRYLLKSRGTTHPYGNPHRAARWVENVMTLLIISLLGGYALGSIHKYPDSLQPPGDGSGLYGLDHW